MTLPMILIHRHLPLVLQLQTNNAVIDIIIIWTISGCTADLGYFKFKPWLQVGYSAFAMSFYLFLQLKTFGPIYGSRG